MERLMQYVWQHRLWAQHNLRTVDGRRVSIIDPGRLNIDAGPDFFNAKIRIGDEMWVGNVEIHVAASDWFRHHHDKDRAYDSVILHVVDKNDAQITRPGGGVIPQMRMPCQPQFHIYYHQLVENSAQYLPCGNFMSNMESMYIADWIQALGYERLYDKSDRIQALVERFRGDWEAVCYVIVARSLGFGLNSDPFERLALSLPLKFIGRKADSMTSIEALLFGQSGLLESAPPDNYVNALKTEYAFLARKYGLKSLSNPGWKMARTRPVNFPHRRIALLAAMLYGDFRMLTKIISVKDADEACELFSVELTGYWKSHTHFSGMQFGASSLSIASRRILVINAVSPLMAAYGAAHGDERLVERAQRILEELPPESNRYINIFSAYGLKPRDAFESQAIIQLRRNYCEAKKCLFCRIGHRMLSDKALREA